MPSLLVWEKLRPVLGGDDLAEALRAEVRDGLWLLARQWQLGELEAEDAGTAAAAHLVARAASVSKFAPAVGRVQKLEDDWPVNAAVEQVVPAFDLTLRLETGREWLRMLLDAGKTEAGEKFRGEPLLRFEAGEPEYRPDDPELPYLVDDSYAQLLVAVGRGRMLDGGRLYELLGSRSASAFLDEPDPEVDALARRWRAWVSGLVEPAAGRAGAWNAAQLSYRFQSAASALDDGSARCFETAAHDGRGLDWFGFEPAPCAGGLPGEMEAETSEHRWTVIPSPVAFPGMPRARWWELEEGGINFSNLRAAKTDTGALLLAEFGLLFSNDWLIAALPATLGSLVRLRRVQVTDVFGVQSSIASAYGREESAQWEIFRTAPAGSAEGLLLLPPVHDRWLQGPPVEEVHFSRDEMANVVWAIERVVPDGLGQGTEGDAAGRTFEQRLRELAGAPVSPAPALQRNDAALRYVLATEVLPHWIPFIPVRPDPAKPDMVLRRAAMPRLIEGQEPTRIRPRSRLLRVPATSGRHYDLSEAEVPANGLSVRAVWRRARWYDGRTVTWLAHERGPIGKFAGSNLAFDTIVGA